jgi:hypothetical protein
MILPARSAILGPIGVETNPSVRIAGRHPDRDGIGAGPRVSPVSAARLAGFADQEPCRRSALEHPRVTRITLRRRGGR